VLPRHLQIVREIDRRLVAEVEHRFPGDAGMIQRVSVLADHQLHMSNLAIVGSHSVNGVAVLHSKLVKETLAPDFFKLYPERFNNKTNGVTPRRWLLYSNRLLAGLISNAIGDEWIRNLDELRQLEHFVNDSALLERLDGVKRRNKVALARVTRQLTGVVIDPLAQPRRCASAAWLAALEQGTPEAALADLLKIPGLAVDCARFETVFNLSAARAASMYQSSDALILGRAQRVAIARAAAAAIGDGVLARLGEFHRAQAQAPGIDIAALRKQVAPWLPADAFSFLLRDLAEARKLEVQGSAVRLPGHDATSNAADEEMWRAVLPALLAGRYTAPTIAELARSLGLNEAKLQDFLHRKSKTGEVMRVAEDLFYPKATLATLAANAALVARSASKGLFSAAQYRDATGIGRTRAIKILEFFDTLGITQRIGDTRKMHKNFVPILGPAKPALAAAFSAGKDVRARP